MEILSRLIEGVILMRGEKSEKAYLKSYRTKFLFLLLGALIAFA